MEVLKLAERGHYQISTSTSIARVIFCYYSHFRQVDGISFIFDILALIKESLNILAVELV
jgi:hypothetical protein